MGYPTLSGFTFRDMGALPAAVGETVFKDGDIFLHSGNVAGRLLNLAGVAVSSAYTILDNDGYTIFYADTSGGAFTLTLPTAADNTSRSIIVIKTSSDANVLTIDGEGAETINGDATQTITRQYKVLWLLCNGTEWFIVPLESDTNVRCVDIDLAIPKRPAGAPPGEGTEDGFPTLDYDDTAEEEVFLFFQLPHEYVNGGVFRVHFDFFVDTAPDPAEDVVWGLEYKKQAHGDNFDFDAGTTTVTTTETVTAGTPANDKKIHESSALACVTTGWAPHNIVLMRFYRDATAVADDLTGDARMLHIHIEYEADATGET